MSPRLRDLLTLGGVPQCGHKSRLGRCVLDKGHSGRHIYPDALAARRRNNRK